jgi:hypothetical protein
VEVEREERWQAEKRYMKKGHKETGIKERRQMNGMKDSR